MLLAPEHAHSFWHAGRCRRWHNALTLKRGPYNWLWEPADILECWESSDLCLSLSLSLSLSVEFRENIGGNSGFSSPICSFPVDFHGLCSPRRPRPQSTRNVKDGDFLQLFPSPHNGVCTYRYGVPACVLYEYTIVYLYIYIYHVFIYVVIYIFMKKIYIYKYMYEHVHT